MRHHFISYSAVDALDVALAIAQGLEGGQPAIPVWLDKLEKDRHRLRPGEAWDEQLVEGIRGCDSLLFLMTADSTDPLSVCKNEWTRALTYKKPVIPIRVEAGVEMPFRLDPREAIELDGAFATGLERLRQHLLWLDSPPGVLRTLEYRLADAERALRRADDGHRDRVLAEIAQLKQQIAEHREAVAHPEAVASRLAATVADGIARERDARAPIVVHPTRVRVVNQPPGAVPAYFQDRDAETALLVDRLRQDTTRVTIVVGRGGVGKTTFACRVLKATETGQSLRGVAPPDADAIVYLTAAGTRRVSVAHLYADLCRLLPGPRAADLAAVYANPVMTTAAKMEALLGEFNGGRVLVLLDNLEDVIDPEQLSIKDGELHDAIAAMLTAPAHSVMLVVTTRIAPRDVLLVEPGRQARIDLDEGLPSPYAENILREMDADGRLGLRDAPAALLDKARVRTRGYPRALEALFAILSADRDTTLEDVLADTAGVFPEHVMRVLVGEAFSRLDAAAQRVVESLAIYDRPVTAAAVEYLLQPYLSGVAATPILGRLVNLQFVRKDGRQYSLHPVDSEYALRRLPRGTADDRTIDPPPFSQIALLHRAAGYFAAARPPVEQWRTLADLQALLAEFDLRCDGDDYAGAFGVLQAIDDQLLQWGHYRLSYELNARLNGHLEDKAMQAVVLRAVGNTASRLGRYAQAIAYQNDALALARELQAQIDEAYVLYSIGWCYGELGQTEQAVDFTLQSLHLAQATGNTWAEGDTLSLLGWYYGKLGQVGTAIDHCQRAVDMLRVNGHPNSVATALSNLAGVLIDAGRYGEAITAARESLQVDPESINLRNWSNGFIARSCLATGDLIQARAAAEVARSNDEPENNSAVLSLLGIICLRQGEQDAAANAFNTAVTQANVMLEFAASFSALDAKGVALAGLALCGDPTRITEAVDAHRAARAINRDAGVRQRLEWLYAMMAPADAAGVLAAPRDAARGTDTGSDSMPGN